MREGLIVAVNAPGAAVFYMIGQNGRATVREDRGVLRHRFESHDAKTLVRRWTHKQHRSRHQPELLLSTHEAPELNVLMMRNRDVVLAGNDQAQRRWVCLFKSQEVVK